MMLFAGKKWVLCLGLAVGLISFGTGRAEAQNPNLKPSFGSVNLNAGFSPDPFVKPLVAGGPIQTDKGGVKAFVADAPDFQVTYTKGNFPLTFFVESQADTTLLIKLPNGQWLANDDSNGNLNPMIRIPQPESGRYDVWVGTFNKGNPQATLKITELK